MHETTDTRLAELLGRLVENQQKQIDLQDALLRRDMLWRNLRLAAIALALVAGPLIYSVGLNNLLTPQSGSLSGDYAALVRMEGAIAADAPVSAGRLSGALRRAFDDDRARAVVLLVNSPGGSPVQAGMISERIRALRVENPDRPVWAIGEDQMTSGAYLIASAADRICVNAATLTGSIGVVYSSWGLDQAIETLGVERRLFSAGEHKTRLDMFSALQGEDRDKMDEVLSRLHAQFIAAVQANRRERLSADPALLFSGDFWTGDVAVELGLADQLCTVTEALQQLGVTHARDFTPRPPWLRRLSDQVAVSMGHALRAMSVPRPMYLP